MPLTAKIAKTYFERIMNMYPDYPEVKAVELPLTDPYNAQNGQYKAYLSTFINTNLGAISLPRFFDVDSLTQTPTRIEMVIFPTTWTFPSVNGQAPRYIILKQVMPLGAEELCAVIDFGANIAVDGDVTIDFSNTGFIAFESSNYI